MAVELVMPRLSESMEEGTIVSWLVADGAPVREGDEIAEIETDKATLPYEAPETGVLRILVPEGTTLALGQPIGLIDDLAPLPAGPANAPNPATTWSPAWGPQPAASRGVQPPQPSAEDEGETTEFAALGTDAAAPADPTPVPANPTPVAAPEPPDAHDDRASVLADDGSQAYGTLFGGPQAPSAGATHDARQITAPEATPDEAAADALAAAEAAEPAIAAMPWVDTSFSPKAAPTAHEEAAPGASSGDARRFTPDELIAPATLPPRPPALQRTETAGARIPASPVARRLARELGIDLATIQGTGPEGRVVRADIEAAQATGAARPPKQAAAVPTSASEFTPPVDEQRSAAPIPAAEPAEPQRTEAAPPAPAHEPPAAETETETDPADALVAAAADVAAQLTASDDPDVVSPPLAPAAAETEPDAEHPTGQPASKPDDAVPEPLDDAVPEPLDDAVPEPLDDAVPEPLAEAAPEPVAEPEPGVLAAQPGRGKGDAKIVELTRQQQTVARRMAESKATIPDFHTVVEVHAAPLMALRAELAATRPDLAAPSVNDLLVKATAVALRAFPALNGAYRDGRVEQYPHINVGIAVEADGALLVPVIHDADGRSVSQIAARSAEVVAKAKDGSLRPPDIASATFTLSNLGTYGVDQFTAVITPGQVGILTAGAISERPVVRDGAVVAGHMLTLTLTTDHRAVYGAEAARFLGRVRQLLERPSSLLA